MHREELLGRTRSLLSPGGLPRRGMTWACVDPDWHWSVMPTSGMLSVPLFRKIFFVRELVQAVLYLVGGSGKKLAAYQV